MESRRKDFPMRKLVAGVISAALIGVTALSSAAPAQAQYRGHDRDFYVTQWCDAHRGAPDCRDWGRGHHWSSDQYHNFYGSHRSAFPAAVGGLFGFALGAAAASAANNNRTVVVTNDSSHIRACERAYRSYDVRTDSYMGFDGDRHRCTL
jgi:hypothetical protein